MSSHTREDIQIIARRKAIDLLARGKVSCKDILNSHEWAVAFANYIEVQSASDKLALMSLFSLPSSPRLPLHDGATPAGMRPAGP